MKQIVVISGKGGTGKTMLAASFAVLVKNKIMVDCDVDAANLHLLLRPRIMVRHDFIGGKTARIDGSVCLRCGRCIAACRFEAITKDFKVDPFACEGCELCRRMCPAQAITMTDVVSGEQFYSETKYGPFIHAKLGIAQSNSGKLVARIRGEAKDLAESLGMDFVIIDGPPGIGCPVIASLSGADLAVIVTEPTVSGRHDLERILDVAVHFKVKTQVVINKYDLNPDYTANIKSYCDGKGIDILGEIPFSPDIPKAVVQGMPPVEFADNEATSAIKAIWSKLERNFTNV